MGKFIGLATMLAAFALLLNGAVVGLARAGRSARRCWRHGRAGLAILVLESLPLLALAVLGSTRLPTLANGVMCTAAYGLGFIGGLIEEIGGLIGNRTMGNIGILSSLLMPLQALHRMALVAAATARPALQQNGPPGMGGGSLPKTHGDGGVRGELRGRDARARYQGSSVGASLTYAAKARSCGGGRRRRVCVVIIERHGLEFVPAVCSPMYRYGQMFRARWSDRTVDGRRASSWQKEENLGSTRERIVRA